MESASNRGPPSWAAFHEAAVLCGVWLLVLFVGIHTLSAMNAILVPLLWAFFFMMGLLPAADFTENVLFFIFTGLGAILMAIWRQVVQCFCAVFSCCRKRGRSRPHVPEVEVGAYSSSSTAVQPRESGDEDEAEALHRQRGTWLRQISRVLAVLIVVGCFVGLIALFVMMVVKSVGSMKSNWEWYKKGAERIAKDVNKALEGLSRIIPPSMVEKMTKQALSTLEDTVTSLLQPVMEHLTGTLVEVLMMLLYMAFWLCKPIEINSTVANLFKRYIMLKGLSSALYSACVWFLLHCLGVDLAVVFGCTTFALNFVPEVGPFIASVLPAPVILFDGRLPYPWFTLAVALGGTLGLKFFFGNVFEVKLIEKDRSMKMHPVVILFCVAFFGFVWGPTGMLLSVPIMATVKALAQRDVLPPIYRDGVLRLLEGAKQRPRAASAERPHTSLVEGLVRLLSPTRTSPPVEPHDIDSSTLMAGVGRPGSTLAEEAA